MSRNTPRRRARIDELIDELCIGAAMRLRCDSDDIHPVVREVVAYLVEEYPAQDLYIPASLTISYPIESIRAALGTGRSMRSVCKQFRIGRGTLYRLLDKSESA